jgi:hypothetical protein
VGADRSKCIPLEHLETKFFRDGVFFLAWLIDTFYGHILIFMSSTVVDDYSHPQLYIADRVMHHRSSTNPTSGFLPLQI